MEPSADTSMRKQQDRSGILEEEVACCTQLSTSYGMVSGCSVKFLTDTPPLYTVVEDELGHMPETQGATCQAGTMAASWLSGMRTDAQSGDKPGDFPSSLRKILCQGASGFVPYAVSSISAAGSMTGVCILDHYESRVQRGHNVAPTFLPPRHKVCMSIACSGMAPTLDSRIS